MKALLLGAALTAASSLQLAPEAYATDLPFVLTATPTLVLPALLRGKRLRLHLEVLNQNAAYCSFSLTDVAQPAQPANASSFFLGLPALPPLTAAAAGSFAIIFGKPVDFAPEAIPSGEDLWCVGDVDQQGNGTNFTVDVLQSGS